LPITSRLVLIYLFLTYNIRKTTRKKILYASKSDKGNNASTDGLKDIKKTSMKLKTSEIS